MADTDEIEAEELPQGADTLPAVEDTAEPAKPEWTEEDETQAKAFGWKPAHEWNGERPKGYIENPRKYLDHADSFRPFRVLRERTEKMEREFQQRFERYDAVTTKTIERQKAEYERDMAAIKAAKLDAVESADRPRFEALERQEQAIPKPVDVPQVQPERPAPVAEVAEYAKTNDWVNNPILRRAGAELIDAAGMADRPVPEQLAYAEREVRKLYPSAFAPVTASIQATARPQVQRVDSGGLGGGGSRNPFDALPAEAKSSFKRFAAQGIFADTPEDRKRYADDYNS